MKVSDTYILLSGGMRDYVHVSSVDGVRMRRYFSRYINTYLQIPAQWWAALYVQLYEYLQEMPAYTPLVSPPVSAPVSARSHGSLRRRIAASHQRSIFIRITYASGALAADSLHADRRSGASAAGSWRNDDKDTCQSHGRKYVTR